MRVGRSGPGHNRVRRREETPSTSASEVERVVVDGGVVMSYPKGWRVRCFWENSAAAAAAAAAGDGVALANLPGGVRAESQDPAARRSIPPADEGRERQAEGLDASERLPVAHQGPNPARLLRGGGACRVPVVRRRAPTPAEGVGSSVGDAFVLRVVVDGVTL